MVVIICGNEVAIMLDGRVMYLPDASVELTSGQLSTARIAYSEGRTEVTL